MTDSATSSVPWDLIPHEPDLWFRRFREFYLLYGPERSVETAFGNWKTTTPEGSLSRAKRPPTNWRKTAAKWRWAERAEAWDEVNRAELRRAVAEKALAETSIVADRELSRLDRESAGQVNLLNKFVDRITKLCGSTEPPAHPEPAQPDDPDPDRPDVDQPGADPVS